MEMFDTHKFLFTLNYEKRVKGHSVVFVDRDDKERRIELDRVEIGTSFISCKLFDLDKKRYLVPFIRIRKIYLGDTLVWDSSDLDLSQVKVIKGFK